MMQIKIFSYSQDLVISNNYLEVIIQYLNPKIFNEKDKNRIKPQLSH